jgi:hypothetical protein
MFELSEVAIDFWKRNALGVKTRKIYKETPEHQNA